MLALIAAANLQGLLIGFLILVIVLAIIAGLLWCIENWISPIPPPVKLVLAIIVLILVILWAIGAITGSDFHL
jgi:hypothetical protein